MLTINFVVGALALLSAFLSPSNAATCSAYTTSSTCSATSVCAWNSASNSCACNAVVDFEVVFVMDASGSVTYNGWKQERSFVAGMATSGLSSASYVGIVQFSSLNRVYTNYTFNMDQTRTTISNQVNKAWYTGGSTATSTAMITAVNIFTKYTKHLPRIIMLVTDGNPNPPDQENPCDETGANKNATKLRNSLKTWNITTIMVAVGPLISKSTLDCLYNNNPSQVISVSNFTAAALNAARTKTDAYLCPTQTDVKISELRVEVSSSGQQGGNARFLELYNNGIIIDFKGNNLILSGYVTGKVSNYSVAKGQYFVLYDNTNTDMKCWNCTCAATKYYTSGSLGSNKRCSNAVYIPCGGTGGQACSFDTTMTNSYWKQTVSDSIDKVTWIDIYQNSTTNNLATVYKGYTFEVIDISTTSALASNWQKSCTPYGTPGDKPLSTCTQGCVQTICQASDTSATCNSGLCDCTAANHYYSQGTQCALLAPPTTCITYIEKDDYGNQFGTVAFSEVSLSYSYEFVITYELSGSEETATTESIYFVYTAGATGIDPTKDTAPTVKVVITADAFGNRVSSAAVTCPFVTWAPTGVPTKTPTKKPTKKPTSPPTKPPTKKPTKKPTKPPTKVPTKRPTSQPTAHPTVSGYRITNCNVTILQGTTDNTTIAYTLIKKTTVSDSDLSLTLQLNLNGSSAQTGYTTINSNPDSVKIPGAAATRYYLWASYRSFALSGEYTGIKDGANCTIITSAPTKAPTKRPTTVPTKKPTAIPTTRPTRPPTAQPTPRPTYKPVEVKSCTITLGKFDKSNHITTADIAFTEPTLDATTPSSSDLEYAISWDGTNQATILSQGSGSKINTSLSKIEIVSSDIVQITAIFSDSGAAAGGAVNCTVNTLSPTRSPSPAPHAPTQAPIVPDITLALDSKCSPGTKDVTGKIVYICSYEANSNGQIEVDLSTGATSFDVNFKWDIVFNHSLVEPNFTLASEAIASPADLGNKLNGSGTIEAHTTGTTFSIIISAKSNVNCTAEVAWLRLRSCSYLSALTCSVAAGDDEEKYFRIAITQDTSGNKNVSDNKKGKLPSWVWYPIAAGVLILAGLAAFGYMYYNKRKLAEEQLQQREADLQQAEELDNLDNFGALGDNITFNPIATAGTQDVATGGEYIDKQLAKQQKHAEFAQVDVDKEVWRQDFGQVKADRHSEV